MRTCPENWITWTKGKHVTNEVNGVFCYHTKVFYSFYTTAASTFYPLTFTLTCTLTFLAPSSQGILSDTGSLGRSFIFTWRHSVTQLFRRLEEVHFTIGDEIAETETSLITAGLACTLRDKASSQLSSAEGPDRARNSARCDDKRFEAGAPILVRFCLRTLRVFWIGCESCRTETAKVPTLVT